MKVKAGGIMTKSQNILKVIFKEIRRITGKNIGLTCLVLIIGVIEALLLLGNTVVLRNFFEKITYAVKNNINIEYTLKSFLILCTILIIGDIFNAIGNFFADKQTMVCRKNIMEEFYKKIRKIKPIEFEDPKILDTINKGKIGLDGSINVILSLEFILSNYTVYFIFITIYLYKIHPLLSLSIFCVFIPTFFSYGIRNKIKSDLEDNIAIKRRKVQCYEDYIGHRDYFKETRHLNAVEFFKGKLENSLDELIYLNSKAFNKINIIKLIINIIYFLGFIVLIGIIYYLTLIKAISIAETAVVLTTVTTMYNRMDSLFNSHIASISENYNSLFNLNKILDYDNIMGNEKLDKNEKELKISIKNMSFKYPNFEKYVLNNISVDINSGEIIAVVGENGSGKTTFSKIVAGLYEPTKGDIYYNGISFKNLDFNSLYNKNAVVFQKFNKYPITIKENVALEISDKIDEHKVENELKKVNLHYIKENMDNGLNTLLSREFGGTDLSTGQWQRLAIARANYKDALFIVFDEPTASLDPLQEIDIMESFIKSTKNKTRILVTHRIGAARLADRIITMKNGKIVEIGTHEELSSINGEYASLYNYQRQWYNN